MVPEPGKAPGPPADREPRKTQPSGAVADDMKHAGILVDRLKLMFDWYKGMVDQRTGRVLYIYDPHYDLAIGDGEPIRDIATVWAVEVLNAFLGRDDLSDLIRRSLAHFDQRVSSSIAHSAFLALTLAHSDLPDKTQRLTPLAEGLVRQQRDDGSYQVFFDAAPDAGEELYPAEAMLALLEAHRLTGDTCYLHGVERGFGHYKRGYYDHGLLNPDLLVFFATWQSQAGRALFAATSRPELKDLVRTFLFELQDRIVGSGFYDRVARRPEAQACVEVACGLEGFADTYAIAASSRDRRTADYRRCITSALGLLIRAQRTTNCIDRERGGFGGSATSRGQRIDVTGHVASGFIKSVENGITEP